MRRTESLRRANPEARRSAAFPRGSEPRAKGSPSLPPYGGRLLPVGIDLPIKVMALGLYLDGTPSDTRTTPLYSEPALRGSDVVGPVLVSRTPSRRSRL